MAFQVHQASSGRSAPSALFAEVTALLLAASKRQDACHALLSRALGILLANAPPVVAHADAGIKATSLIALGAAEAFKQQAKSAGMAAAQQEVAAMAAVRLLVGVAQGESAGAAVAVALLAALHAPLLMHPKAAARKLLLDLAAAAISGAGSERARSMAAVAGVRVLACMAGDRDATVRAKSLAVLTAAVPDLISQCSGGAAARTGNGGGEGCGPMLSVQEAVLPRLQDSSRSVRRNALQLLAALVAAACSKPDRGSGSGEGGGSSAGWGLTSLLSSAFQPLMVLSDTPPASPGYDEACQAAALQLLEQLPALMRRQEALDMLLSCNSDSGCVALLGALLQDHPPSNGGRTRGSSASCSSGASAAYCFWESAVQSMGRPQIVRLRALCLQLQSQGGGAGSGRGGGSRWGAIEQLRQHAFGALSAQLGGLMACGVAGDRGELSGVRGEAAAGSGGGSLEEPPTAVLLPANTLRRLGAAARVLAVTGGIGGACAAATGGQRAGAAAAAAAAVDDAVGEAAILVDALEVLLQLRQQAGEAGVGSACGATAAAVACAAGNLASTVDAAGKAEPAAAAAGTSEPKATEACSAGPPAATTGIEAEAAPTAGPEPGAVPEGGLLVIDDAFEWVLEVAATAADGPLRPHLASVLRWPLVFHMSLIEACPFRCVDLAMKVRVSGVPLGERRQGRGGGGRVDAAT